MSHERIERELAILREGGQIAGLIQGTRLVVLYRDVPTGRSSPEVQPTSDVIVPVPPGYPGGPIDLAGLPADSPLLRMVKGGQNSQGIVEADGRRWQLASYHPYSGGGGPSWDQTKHGFHTYLDHLIAWLARLN